MSVWHRHVSLPPPHHQGVALFWLWTCVFVRSCFSACIASPGAGLLPPPSVIRVLSVARDVVVIVLLNSLHRLAESTSLFGASPPLLLLSLISIYTSLGVAGLKIERGDDAAAIGLPPEVGGVGGMPGKRCRAST